MRKKFISITSITELAARSNQISAEQCDESATTTEFHYIAVDVGAASSL